MADGTVTSCAIKRVFGELLFQNTALQAQNEQLRAELQAKAKELAAANLALSVLQPMPVTSEDEPMNFDARRLSKEEFDRVNPYKARAPVEAKA